MSDGCAQGAAEAKGELHADIGANDFSGADTAAEIVESPSNTATMGLLASAICTIPLKKSEAQGIQARVTMKRRCTTL